MMAAKKKAAKKAKRKSANPMTRKVAKKPAKKTKAKKSGAAKPTPRKTVKAKKKSPVRKKKQIVGEGDYEASRAFLKDQAGFVAKNKARIPGMGKQARAALEGSEGPSLLAAEAEAKSHSKAGSEE
jgi:hypothetical protein